MSQDILSDALNNMLNIARAGKDSLSLKKHSKLLLLVLAIAKLKGYVKNYRVEDNVLNVEIGKLNFCKAIKPRFVVRADEIEKYVQRYLPAKDIGVIIISTPEGLMTHQTAQEKNIGGSLIAYFY
ncbi:MAG: 30S ribosomal protein S8 [Candidatus Pacearchaeota archaeon]